MDTERNLLFGVVAFQNGTVDADRLAETCAAWAAEPNQPLANLFVDRGLMTDEQKTEVEKVVAHELEAHGGDPQATLAATMDGRSREAIRDAAGSSEALEAQLNLPAQAQGGHVVLGTLSPADESRERYTLTHLHAKGGMGRVWLARDGALGRQIALKELRPDQADNSIVCSRFLYEAKITAQLEHPGIVPVYELGEGESPYYTMRFVRGRTLSEAIRAYHKKRAAGEADSVAKVELFTAFVNVCHAVAYAHSRGIIHRDLKGQNVVLGDFGEVMVLDWGLAKRVGPDQQADSSEPEAAIVDPVRAPAGDQALGADPVLALTCGTDGNHDDDATLSESHDLRLPPASNASSNSSGSAKDRHRLSSNGTSSHRTNSSPGRHTHRESGAGPEGTMQGQLLGTPAYMAPEQAQGRHDLVDERTDVYGLGAILYEILTGRPPFIAPKTSEIIRKVCQEAPTPPRQIVADTPASLEGVCLKALRKPLAERYLTAAELGQEVQRYLADEPVQAYREPWTSRISRWARRHRTAVAAAAALLVTATIALAVSTVLVTNEKKEAETQGQQARHAVQLLTKVADIGFDDQLDPLQKEFLEDALQYYEAFTSRVAHDPAVRQEHGRIYQQMGDIQRKLGRLPESKQSYLKAIEILEPLASHAAAGPEPRRALARARTLLADLLVRSGGDKGQAEPLYTKAAEAQQALAAAPAALPAAATEDRLRLGQTVKSQGDLLRLSGKWTEAKDAYDRAIADLELAQASATKNPEIRDNLAMAIEARGWIYRELGEVTPAENDYRRALDLLDKLVAEFPTVPRHRESLAKVCNSLGIIGQETGRLDDAEVQLRREVPLVERLSQDFPDRPEYRRELARALNVFGSVLRLRGNVTEAEPMLRRSIDLDTAILAKSPDDVLVSFQLGMAHHHLGEILRNQGKMIAAIDSLGKARDIHEALAKEFPDQPRYASNLAADLDSLAVMRDAAGQPGAIEVFQAANSIYERLVAKYPAAVDYKIWQANCLRNHGLVLAEAGKPEEGEKLYRQSLNLLETIDAHLQSPDALRKQAMVLSNLGILHKAGALDDFRRSIAISEKLLANKTGASDDRFNLAVAQNNLSELLIELRRLPEAGPHFTESVANFEKLVAEAPRSLDYQHVFGIVLAGQAKWLDQSGKPADARVALTAAVDHQRQAVRLGNNAPVCSRALADHLLDLAEVNRKLGAYDEAARLALDLPKAAPSSGRAQACYDAARVLARLVAQADGDGKLHQADRDRLSRTYLTRTVVLLREAIDSNPKLAEQIKTDRDIKVLESKPQFLAIMNTLVDVAVP
jgi:eukaryotic-like serine/threonine-protein kinase